MMRSMRHGAVLWGAKLEAEYQALKAGWSKGERDREAALRLMFYAWMHWAEPPHVTGLSDDPDSPALWLGAFASLGGEKADGPEFLHAAGMMATLFPWGLGEEALWEQRGREMARRSLLLRPGGFSPAFFEGRGDYGDYFAHQARSAQSRN
jgi:hypothetical protein